MQNNEDFNGQLLKFGLDLGFLISGFFGALALSVKRKKQKISKTILCIITGTLSANFLTPVVLTLAPETLQEKGKYAVAFMMGYIGLKGLEEFVDFMTEYLKSKKPS
jgi:hypothetical protein